MSGRRIAFNLAASILSGLYWLGFFFLAEAFTAADYRGGLEPSSRLLRAKGAAVVAAGVVGYALCMDAWRRLTR